jgi:hypothetical protein
LKETRSAIFAALLTACGTDSTPSALAGFSSASDAALQATDAGPDAPSHAVGSDAARPILDEGGTSSTRDDASSTYDVASSTHDVASSTRDDASSTQEDADATMQGRSVDAGSTGTWVDISPYGLMSALGLAVAPSAPGTLYVNAKTGWPPSDPKSGIYKSTDGGNSWGAGPIGTAFYNYDGTVYTGGNPWQVGVSWTLAVDPTDADVVYAHCSFFGPQGPWKTTDGGASWRSILSSADAAQMTPDVYAITIDPLDHLHVLMTFHSPWATTSPAGIAESKDGGATWLLHPPPSGVDWGTGHYAFFLGQDDAGAPSSTAWMLATQSAGFWRSLDAGATWTQVSATYGMQHGGGALYRASTGALYMGAVSHLIRSTDNGQTWTDAGAPSNEDGYNSVIGDGTRMYVQSANTGTNTTGPQPFYTSLETDGTHWTPQNTQTFPDGPGWMAVDRKNQLVYASLWDQGLWRLATGD